MRRILLRLWNLWPRASAERELAREVEMHVALLEEEFRERGMTAAEARRAAQHAIGGVEQTKERYRDAHSFGWIEDARRDVVLAARLLRHNPAFALTAIVSLAVGIGANTAIFTVTNALLFRAPAGVVAPDRLVDIGTSRPDGGFNPTSYPAYLDVRERATTLAGVYAQQLFPQAVSFGETAPAAATTSATGGARADAGAGAAAHRAEHAFAHFVATSYFAVLGTRPASGRLFDATDRDRPGASPIAVLSHTFWRRRFGADPSVVGRTLRISGQPVTIVGVAPEGFQGTAVFTADMWLPLSMAITPGAQESFFTNRGAGSIVIGARLKPGVSVARAAAELGAIGRAIDQEHPSGARDRTLRLVPSSRVPGSRSTVAAFMAGLTIIVALVLIVACANVAGILMVRSAARRREIAVRLAIGAGPARLVRQLLTETLLLFAIGGAGGLLLADLMTMTLVPLLPALPFPIQVGLALDTRVIAFTMGLTFASALLAGLVPALQASKADVVGTLKDDSQGPQGPPRGLRTRWLLRKAFVIAQVAFSLVLVITAGLFARALQLAGARNPGFDPRGVELASLDLSMDRYTDDAARRFARELAERVRAMPGVQAATIAIRPPGGFEEIGLGGVTLPGASAVAPTDDESFAISWDLVEPGYFATLGIPLVAGRDFEATDLAGAPAVAIISESVARHFFGGQQAVGRLLSWPGGSPAGTRTLLVVGVVGDVKSSTFIDGLAGSYVYVPLQQQFLASMFPQITIAVRTAHGGRIVGELRALVAGMNPNLPIVQSQTLEESTALGLVAQRIAASMSGSLGGVGLLLAAIGLYGVTAYTVARRTREIGIRIALGATRRDVVRLVIAQGMTLVVAGSAIGLLLASIVGVGLGGFLLGVPAIDPFAFIGATALFAIVGLLACYLPARRATRVDPLDALRQD